MPSAFEPSVSGPTCLCVFPTEAGRDAHCEDGDVRLPGDTFHDWLDRAHSTE